MTKLTKEKVQDLIGQKFGKLTIIKKAKDIISPKGGKSTTVLCRCECGNTKIVRLANLKKGHTKSCGCLDNSGRYKPIHGLSKTRLHGLWRGIKQRCYCETCKDYKNYGAKGIVMCEEWKNDFLSFYKWSYSNGYNDNLTIDRINFTDIYKPSNCRWVTTKIQNQNTSRNVFITYKNITLHKAEWLRKLGVGATKFNSFIKKYGEQQAIEILSKN